MSTHLININDCTTPYDGANQFPHLMPLRLFPLDKPKEGEGAHLLPKDERGLPTNYKVNVTYLNNKNL